MVRDILSAAARSTAEKKERKKKDDYKKKKLYYYYYYYKIYIMESKREETLHGNIDIIQEWEKIIVLAVEI